MQYFNNFPKILYDITGRGDFKVVTDLLRRVKVRDGIKNNISLFDKYFAAIAPAIAVLTSVKYPLSNSIDLSTPVFVSNKIIIPLVVGRPKVGLLKNPGLTLIAKLSRPLM